MNKDGGQDAQDTQALISREGEHLICRVERRSDGLYVVRGDKAVGPYESIYDAILKAERCRIAEELGTTEDDVKKALLNYNLPEEPKIVEIRLGELRAELHGRRVRVKARIVGMSDPMAIPRFLRIDCECGCGDIIDLLDERELATLRNYLFDRRKLGRRLCSCGRIGRLVEREGEMLDYTVIYATDIQERVFDGVRRKHRIHLIGVKLPRGVNEAEFLGHVVRGASNRLVIIAREASPLHENRYERRSEDEKLFRRYFQSLTPDSIDYVMDRSICPRIVGRADAKVAAALTLHSPLMFYFESELIPGYIWTNFLGDSTTGKSRILEWVYKVLRLGFVGSGDLTSEAGLTGGIDPDIKEIIWGLLPLADGQIALVDNLQRLPSRILESLREIRRRGIVVIRKVVSGEAPARTRILASANPRRPLSSYTFEAQAIVDTRCFADPIDITRWDIIVRFHEEDVPIEEIAKAEATKPLIPPDVFRRHVLWAWSLRPEQIIFTPEAEEAVKKAFKELVELSVPDLPLVHRGWKETIARVATAYAVLLHSTKPARAFDRDGRLGRAGGQTSLFEHALDDEEYVVVVPLHVELARRFLERMLDAWAYREYVLQAKKREELSDDDIKAFKDLTEKYPIIKDMVRAIAAEGPQLCSVLAKKFDISERTIRRYASELKAIGVFMPKQGGPYTLSKKGIQLAKMYIGSEDTTHKEKSLSAGTARTATTYGLEGFNSRRQGGLISTSRELPLADYLFELAHRAREKTRTDGSFSREWLVRQIMELSHGSKGHAEAVFKLLLKDGYMMEKPGGDYIWIV